MKSKKKRRRRLNPLLKVPRRDPNTPFKCDLCGSPYVINPTRRGNRPKLSTHHPSPRHKVDPATGKTLTLCNACGLCFCTVLLHVHVIVSLKEGKEQGFFVLASCSFCSVKNYGRL